MSRTSESHSIQCIFVFWRHCSLKNRFSSRADEWGRIVYEMHKTATLWIFYLYVKLLTEVFHLKTFSVLKYLKNKTTNDRTAIRIFTTVEHQTKNTCLERESNPHDQRLTNRVSAQTTELSKHTLHMRFRQMTFTDRVWVTTVKSGKHSFGRLRRHLMFTEPACFAVEKEWIIFQQN